MEAREGAGGYGGGSGGSDGTQGAGLAGGFGGGGGGNRAITTDAPGGFGAGNGGHGNTAARNVGGSGGGLGAGGAIFVRQGATLTMTDGGITGGVVAGGAPGAKTGVSSSGTTGQGIGSGMFLAGSANYSVSTGNTITISDTIGGGIDPLITGGFTKSGDGTLILTGANSYTGGTTVSAGTLLVSNTSGSGAGAGNVTVGGGIFGGTGTITGGVTVNALGTLAPGSSLGTLHVGNVLFNAVASHFLAEINVGPTLGADLLDVTGSIALNGATLDLSVLNAPPGQPLPRTFLLMANDGGDAVTGTFSSINVPAGFTATVDYAYSGTDALGRTGNGNDLAITLSQVPEPSTMAIGLCAAGLLLAAARRRRRPLRVCQLP